ncbi:MAG: DUF484 family protein [Magnetococcales bacterium]|nr:DUF484 family protein [Magnetococcales bacterium]
MEEDQVCSWLKDHPDFFTTYPDLLPAAILASGKVLSLEAGQLKRLQQQNEQLKERLDGILDRIQRNDEIHQSFHAIQIKLLTAETPRNFLLAATYAPEKHFSIGRITIAINRSEKKIVHLFKNQSDELPEDRLFLVDESELSSTLNTPPTPSIRVGLEGNNRQLFFGPHTDKIRSEALIPLFSHPDPQHKESRLIGALNLGDPSPSRFLPSDSTELLQDLANVLGLCLNRLANKSH